MSRRARPPLPFATVAVALAVVVVFVAELAGDGTGLCRRFGFVAAAPSLGTAVTSVFLHDPRGLTHLLGNLLVLALVGSRVEQAIGPKRFAGLFFAGGVAGAALHGVVDPSSTTPLVGCSGSLFALLAVAAVLFGPGVLAFVAALVATNIWHAFGGSIDEGVSFGAHLGGFFAGTVAVAFARLRGVDLRRAVAA